MDQGTKLLVPSPGASPGGAVALLLPGMSLNATIFPSLSVPTISADFARFDASHEALRPARDGVGNPLMEAYVDVLDDLESEPLWHSAERRIVVAHSFGAMLALAWLIRHRNSGVARVDGVVLSSTTAGPMYDICRVRLGRLVGREFRFPVKPLMKLWDNPTVTKGLKRMAGDADQASPVDFKRLRRPSDWRVGLAGWRNSTWPAKRSFRAAMQGFDAREYLHLITARTIVLHGDRDVYFGIPVAADLAGRLPSAELRIIPGAGHTVPLTHGDRVRQAAEELLG